MGQPGIQSRVHTLKGAGQLFFLQAEFFLRGKQGESTGTVIELTGQVVEATLGGLPEGHFKSVHVLLEDAAFLP